MLVLVAFYRILLALQFDIYQVSRHLVTALLTFINK